MVQEIKYDENGSDIINGHCRLSKLKWLIHIVQIWLKFDDKKRL